MNILKIVGIVALVLSVVGGSILAAAPAMAKGPSHEATFQEAAGFDAPLPVPGPAQRPQMPNGPISGNVKSVAAGSLVISNLAGKDVTFQTDANTQYRYALGITDVRIGYFVTIMGRRVPGANPLAKMIIVNSTTSRFFLQGAVTAKNGTSFTVKSGNKDYIINVDSNTTYKVVTPPPPQPRPAPGAIPRKPQPPQVKPQPQGKPRPGVARGASLSGESSFKVQLVANGPTTPPAPRPTPVVTNGTFDSVKVGLRVNIQATGSATSLLALNVVVNQPPVKPVSTPTPVPPTTVPNAGGKSPAPSTVPNGKAPAPIVPRGTAPAPTTKPNGQGASLKLTY